MMWGGADHGHVGQLPVGPERHFMKQMQGGLVCGSGVGLWQVDLAVD